MNIYKYSRGDKLIYQGKNITIVNSSHGLYDVIEGWIDIAYLPNETFLHVDSTDIDTNALGPFSTIALGAGRKRSRKYKKGKRTSKRRRTSRK
jgi:hypothetical protein